MPPEITLSFVAYSDGLQGWIDMARANGHEVLLEAPMEPLDAAANDPGPIAHPLGVPSLFGDPHAPRKTDSFGTPTGEPLA